MDDQIDRRELLRRASAVTAGAGLLGLTACGGDSDAGARAAQSTQARAEATAAAARRRRVPRRAVHPKPVKKGEVPNLLLVIIDSVRADHLGAYGRRNAHTPNLDAFAREGLRLTDVHPEAFPTGPARATIFGGTRLFPFRDWTPPKDMPGTPGWQPVPDENLISTLRRAGYFTGYAVDTPWVMVPSQQPFIRDWDRFVPIKGQTGTVTGDPSRISDAELARWVPPKIIDSSSAGKMRQYLANQLGRRTEEDYLPARVFKAGMELLEEAKRSKKPFAIAVDCFDPHEPWDPPAKYIKLHGGSVNRSWQPGTVLNGTAATNGLGRRDLKQMGALYRAELTMSDHWFGNFMTRLNELKLDRETLVIFLSDHGFLLGERGYVAKMATQCFPELTHVPMVIRHPEGRGARKTSSYFAQTQDVASTLLAGAGIKRPAWMDGANLLPLLEGRQPKQRRTYVTGAYSSIVFARDRRWTYMGDNQNKAPRLYDRRSDPREVRDVAKRSPGQVQKMYRGMVVRDAGGPLPKLK